MVNKNWYVKVDAIDSKEGRKHPVIKYLNTNYSKNHDGTAQYYGVINNDTWYDNNEKHSYWIINKVVLLTLEQFKRYIVKGIKENNHYELW